MPYLQLSKNLKTIAPNTGAINIVRSTLQVLVIGISTLTILSGCQASKGLFSKVDDGSLAYQKAEKLEPLELPVEQETAPFIPLYPTPPVGVNTLEIENESGKRFELPPPYRQVPIKQESN